MQNLKSVSTVLVVAFGGVLALTTPAAAQARGRSSGPVITHLNDGSNQKIKKAPQGGVINIMGRNFHKCPPPPEGVALAKFRCDHDGLKVTLAGKPVTILATDHSYITISIPQSTRPSRAARLEVTYNRKTAKTTIEIVDWKTFKASSKERASEGGGGQASKEMRILQSFKITKFSQVRTNAGNTFVVEGVAKGVPDRMEVQVKLNYQGKTIPQGTRLLRIEKDSFKTTFGPYSKLLLHGNYSLELLFELGRQSKRLKRKWVKLLSDEEQELYGRIQRREFTQVGTGPSGTVTPEDLARQKTKLQDHYLAYCNEVQELRDKIQVAVADAGRSFFKEGREYNKDQYTRWLGRMGFATTPEETDKIVKSARYATTSGHFKHREYLDFARLVVVKDLISLHEKHRKFNDQYIAPMDAKADQLGDYLLSIVLIKFQQWSQDLYKHSTLPLPETIGRVPVSPIKAPKMSRKFFDAKRRELLRQVGLGKLVKTPG